MCCSCLTCFLVLWQSQILVMGHFELWAENERARSRCIRRQRERERERERERLDRLICGFNNGCSWKLLNRGALQDMTVCVRARVCVCQNRVSVCVYAWLGCVRVYEHTCMHQPGRARVKVPVEPWLRTRVKVYPCVRSRLTICMCQCACACACMCACARRTLSP